MKTDDSRLIKKVFLYDWAKCQEGKYSWCNDIKCVFAECNFLHLFNSKQIVPDRKSTLQEKYFVNWQQYINTMPKLEHYAQLKHHIKCEQYLITNILNRKQRSVLAHARAGTLPIEIEKGSWRSIHREERLCKQCNMATIENISNFLLICPKTIRERLYNNAIAIIHVINLNVTDDEKITLLLSDHKIMKNTANFIIKCMERRC